MSIFDITARSPLFFIIPLAIGLACLVPLVIKVGKESKAHKKAAKIQSDFLKWYNTVSLDEIWRISEQKDFLIAMQGWLQRKYDKQRKSDGTEHVLSLVENTAFDVLTYDNLVYGNGFYDFWVGDSNGESSDSYEASLKAIGATDAAALWHEAVSLISGAGDTIDAILDNSELSEKLSVLDTQFHNYNQSEEMNDLIYRYILRHKSEFSE